jgi:phosphoribosylamine--glycine ligase
MGTYSPAPFFTPELERMIRSQVFDRTLEGLCKDKIPFRGVLYAGLMLTQEGPKILEYNCRFGDPETQVILPRLENDLVEVLVAACEGRLDRIQLKWKSNAAVCVVMVAGGYPGSFQKGDVIENLEAASTVSGVTLFHAGTALKDGDVVTAGGRVLGVTASGGDLEEAIERVYGAGDRIKFKNMQFRRDIAGKALAAI